MVSFGIRFDEDMLKRAKKKSGLVPFSTIIRKLVEKWLSGEIEINPFEDEN